MRGSVLEGFSSLNMGQEKQNNLIGLQCLDWCNDLGLGVTAAWRQRELCQLFSLLLWGSSEDYSNKRKRSFALRSVLCVSSKEED